MTLFCEERLEMNLYYRNGSARYSLYVYPTRTPALPIWRKNGNLQFHGTQSAFRLLYQTGSAQPQCRGDEGAPVRLDLSRAGDHTNIQKGLSIRYRPSLIICSRGQ